jgi:hypothetical protein
MIVWGEEKMTRVPPPWDDRSGRPAAGKAALLAAVVLAFLGCPQNALASAIYHADMTADLLPSLFNNPLVGVTTAARPGFPTGAASGEGNHTASWQASTAFPGRPLVLNMAIADGMASLPPYSLARSSGEAEALVTLTNPLPVRSRYSFSISWGFTVSATTDGLTDLAYASTEWRVLNTGITMDRRTFAAGARDGESESGTGDGSTQKLTVTIPAKGTVTLDFMVLATGFASSGTPPAVTPEPSSFVLGSIGLAGTLAGCAWRRRRFA